MSTKEYVIKEIETLPEALLLRVSEYVEFLKKKDNTDKMGALLVAESALRKDWLSPEEDAAWQDL